MKYFGVYLKSHTNFPDYEDECFANSQEEAVQTLAKRAHCDPDEIREDVQEIDLPNIEL